MLTKTKKNYLWLIAEKSIGVAGVFFINALVAKYVGAAIVGQIAIAVAVFQVVQVAGLFGSDVFLYKRVTLNFAGGLQLLSPILLIRNIIYIVLSVLAILFLSVKMDLTGVLLSFSVCIAYYFYTIDTFSTINESLLNSKVNAIANVLGLLIGLLARTFMVHYKVPNVFFGIPLIIISSVPYFLKIYIFRLQNRINITSTTKKFRKRLVYLCQAGSLLFFPAIITAIYPRLNVILIYYLYGDERAGVYSVSQMIATSWSFVLLSLLTSYLPLLFKEKNEMQIIKIAAKLHLRIIFLAMPVIFVVLLLIDRLIKYLYGVKFEEAILPCAILCFSILFSTLGLASSKVILKFSGYRFILFKTVFVLMFCTLLSFLLSSKFGLAGAAYAIVITEFFSLTVINYLFRQGIVLLVHIEVFREVSQYWRELFGKVFTRKNKTSRINSE